MRKKLFKTLSLSLCLSVASIGMAFADSLDEPVSIKVDDAMYQRQAEIDRLLFDKYVKDLEEKGIFITHTVDTVDAGDYVEVGITPYTPENADIVSKLLDKDNIKVIEGTMAVTLQYNPELNGEGVDPSLIDPAQLADDSQIVHMAEDLPGEAEVAVAEGLDVVEDSSVVLSAEKGEEKSSLGISSFAIVAIGALLAICGTLLFKKKSA